MRTHISILEAETLIFQALPQPRRGTHIIEAAGGLVLAEPITASFMVPPCDNSAVDGYALQAGDIAQANHDHPVILPLAGEIRAGDWSREEVRPGTAMYITTGAPVPPGVDAVCMVEFTERKGGEVAFHRSVKAGENIRKAGEDIQKGAEVLRKGKVLTPGDIAVLASLGIPEVSVFKKPFVAILTTGEELLQVGQAPEPGKIFNSNQYGLQAYCREMGIEPLILGPARDDEAHLRDLLEQGREADVLLTSGGVSMGDKDLVRKVLEATGFKPLFWRVKQKPGGPFLFGKRGGQVVFGLPGNPVSTLVLFLWYGIPALRRLSGETEYQHTLIDVELEEPLRKRPGKAEFVRGVVRWEGGRYVGRSTGPQGSHILTSLSRANALFFLDEEVEAVNGGEKVRALLIGTR